MRGDPQCYDEWAADGNTGWAYNDVLKYFIKAENNTIPYLDHSPLRGKSGPITVSENTVSNPLGEAFLDAGKELHYKVKDLNGKGGEGFMKVQLTTRGGERCSTSKAYLKSIRNRSNLDISMNSRITKILIDGGTKKAYGVRFIRDNVEHVVYAENEIVVSGGTFNSPQILMLSGVGPAKHLKELKIPVIADLPVGQNMRDHTGIFGVPFTISKPVNYDALNFDDHDVIDYAKHRLGKLSEASTQATALVKSKYAKDNIPDMQVFLGPSNIFFNEAAATTLGIKADFYESVYAKLNVNKTISMIAYNVRPKSIGYVKLNTSNPLDAPLINPKYFSDPHDLDVAVEAVKLSLALAETKSFKKFGIKYPGFNYPGCENIKKNTDAYWGCVIRLQPGPFLHATSTCKMGTDNNSVVNPRLLVHGVPGLRVIDASVMPRPTNANAHIPTVMIAEKGSDLIKEDWGKVVE